MSTKKNATINADSEWIASLAQSVKEDQNVIKELAERIKRKDNKDKTPSIKEQVSDILDDAAYCKIVLNSGVQFTMTSMAKDLGMTGAPRLQDELIAIGVIFRQGKVFHLANEFSGYGLTDYKVYKGGQLMVWTQKGRAWLHNLVKRGLLMTEPKPHKEYIIQKQSKCSKERKEYQKMKELQATAETPQAATVEMPKPIRDTEFLKLLIAQMQEHFDCIISLAKDCVNHFDERDRRLLQGDIRSINDSTPLIMRKLESECYKVLAAS